MTKSMVTAASVRALRFVSPDDVETQLFDWGSIKWLAERRVTGSEKATVGLVIVDPGKGHGRHNHPGSEEYLYYVSGEGEQMVENDVGEPIYRHVKAGDVTYIPADVYHGAVNTGWEPLRVVAVYVPGGPEAILRDLPECVVLPPGMNDRPA